MMKKQLVKKVFATALAVSMVFGTAACSSKDKDTSNDVKENQVADKTEDKESKKDNEEKKETKPAESDNKELGKPIEIQGIFWGAEVPTEKSFLMKKVEEKLGVELKPSYILADTSTEKVTTAILSGELPEVISIKNEDVHSQIMMDAAAGDMFWELSDFIDDYPNLKNFITDDMKKGLTVGGKFIGLPRGTINRGGGLVIRQDWLEKFDMKVPRSLDDFYKMFVAFTKDDPDGNGKDDTIGLAAFGGAYVRPLMIAAGCPCNWYIEEGTNKVKPHFLNENFINYLDFYKKLYDEGLVNTEYAAANATQGRELILTQKAGSYPASIGNIISGTQFDALYQNNPDAKLVSVTEIEQPDGKLAAELAAGYYQVYFITKSAVKTEARVREILQFFNDTMNDDIASLYYKGIEGTHYKTNADGQFEWIDAAQFNKDSEGLSCINVYPLISAQMGLNLDPAGNGQLYYDFQSEKGLKDYPMVANWFSANTDSAGVSGTVESASVKYVNGSISKEELQDTIQAWIDGGGQAHMDAWTAQYAEMIK